MCIPVKYNKMVPTWSSSSPWASRKSNRATIWWSFAFSRGVSANSRVGEQRTMIDLDLCPLPFYLFVFTFSLLKAKIVISQNSEHIGPWQIKRESLLLPMSYRSWSVQCIQRHNQIYTDRIWVFFFCLVFVVEPDDYSPQRSKALSIARAENVHLNSFTSLSTVLTAGVSTSSWHWPKHERKSISGKSSSITK